MTSKVNGSSLIIKRSDDMMSSYFQITKMAQAGCSNTSLKVSWSWLRMVGLCVEVLRQLDHTFNLVLGADQGTRNAPPDLTNDIQALISSLEEHKVYKIILGRVLTGENEPVTDVVAIGLQNLTEGAKNSRSEYNTTFHCLQMRRRMTPMTDLPADSDPLQFEPSIITTESVELCAGTWQASIQLDPNLENLVSAAEKVGNHHLPRTPILLNLKKVPKM